MSSNPNRLDLILWSVIALCDADGQRTPDEQAIIDDLDDYCDRTRAAIGLLHAGDVADHVRRTRRPWLAELPPAA